MSWLNVLILWLLFGPKEERVVYVPTRPNPELENLGAVALREAKKLKATYADIRIIRYRQQFLTVRLNPERGTGKTLEVPVINDGGSFGFGSGGCFLPDRPSRITC